MENLIKNQPNVCFARCCSAFFPLSHFFRFNTEINRHFFIKCFGVVIELEAAEEEGERGGGSSTAAGS